MAKQTFTTGQVLTADNMTSLQQNAMGGGSATAKTASYTLVAADAGTTVIMNSASATTITVNTSLFAAGDTVFIVNQGAGVCTITAGTATVSTAGSLAMSQNETGQLYFLSTSAAIFSEYTQAAAGGITLLSTTSLSGATTTISSISASYKNLIILIKDFYPSSNADLLMSVNGDNTAANYAQIVLRGQTTSDGSFADNTVAGAYISGYQVINTQQEAFAEITIPDYTNATTKKMINVLCNSTTNSSAKATTLNACAYHGTVAAITSISIKTLTGSWSAGSVEIYGQN